MLKGSEVGGCIDVTRCLMRFRYRFLCASLGLGLPLAARAQQPFAKLGVTVKILFLSNGRYPEYFPNDSLRRIGTVVYNTRLKKVAYLLPGDSLVGRARSEVVSRWLTVDPLAEKFAHISPYVYVSNNPVRFNDPDGRAEKDVILGGAKRQQAFKQLQAATTLDLKMDKAGKLSATGEAKTSADKSFQAAINSTSVTVLLNATGANTSTNGKWFIGGAFGGSEVKDGKTLTSQTVNPRHTRLMDALSGNPKGSSVTHEVLESYFGGVDSPGSPAPSLDPSSPGFKEYQSAHDKAKAADPRFSEPNISQGSNGQLIISKFPYIEGVAPGLNPEIILFNANKP